MADNPKNYIVDADVMEIIWGTLFESAHDEVARVVSDIMIDQGCQELVGITDSSLILMFWKNYMEDKNILYLVPPTKELN
jgi:hypothetical protein|tara:strand:- start:217 stop:456 length:240 start_codon:yes stop_codon:yes gene_type:complete